MSQADSEAPPVGYAAVSFEDHGWIKPGVAEPHCLLRAWLRTLVTSTAQATLSWQVPHFMV